MEKLMRVCPIRKQRLGFRLSSSALSLNTRFQAGRVTLSTVEDLGSVEYWLSSCTSASCTVDRESVQIVQFFPVIFAANNIYGYLSGTYLWIR